MSEIVHRSSIQGLPEPRRGKVRDVYDLGDTLLIVTTDRISAFDSVLPTGIPDKGRVLNLLSAFWFHYGEGWCPHHLLSVEDDAVRDAVSAAGGSVDGSILGGRSAVVKKTQALPVECVVRGYLDGSAWKEYQRLGSVCDVELPAGLVQGSRLPEPIFTPSTKAETGHDVNITCSEMQKLVPDGVADQLINRSLEVYGSAAEFALARGIILADTKFEFGLLDGEVLMIDECLTPDSSRFWDADQWRPGGPQPSYDKQFVRDHLDSVGWDHEPPAPPLPEDVAERTAEKYREIYRRLTGRLLV